MPLPLLKGGAGGGGGGTGGRPFLTGDTTYYVNNSTGNDANNGLAPGTAWATLTHAMAVINSIDGAGFNVGVNVQGGGANYTEGIFVGQTIGIKNLTFHGVGSPRLKPPVSLFNAVTSCIACPARVQFDNMILDSTDPGFGGWQPADATQTQVIYDTCTFVLPLNDGWHAFVGNQYATILILTPTFDMQGNQDDILNFTQYSTCGLFGPVTIIGSTTFANAAFTFDDNSTFTWGASSLTGAGPFTGLSVQLTVSSIFIDQSGGLAMPGSGVSVDPTSSWEGPAGAGFFSGLVKSGAPTTSDLVVPDLWTISRDTGGTNIGLYYNKAGTILGLAGILNYTVATLPAAGVKGRRAFVTDSLAAPVFNNTLTGGGVIGSPVFDDGAAWRYG